VTEIFIGLAANGEREVLELSRANRHGLIAGATGTGRTVTLQGLAETFSAAGMPLFLNRHQPGRAVRRPLRAQLIGGLIR